MKKIILRLFLITAIFFQVIHTSKIIAQPGQAANKTATETISGTHFIHTATLANSGGNSTYIYNYLTNNNPNALVFVEQNWNPCGVSGVYNNDYIGVSYDGIQWAIYDQNLPNMPEGAAFNVYVAQPGNPNAFVHTATALNTSSYITYLSDPLLDGNPDALVLVTQNWNPGGVGGVINPHSIGVWYDGSRWSIFNQDFVDIPENASFNVLVLSNSTEGFIHTATVDNMAYEWTLIDHPALNGNPNAMIYTTQNWNPLGVYNAKPPAVWYSSSAEKWSIYNQDQSEIPLGASFNIYIGSPNFVHASTASNIFTNLSSIDHPLSNYDNDAKLFVIHNWNPAGFITNYHDKTLGVFDYGNTWGIFNQDESPMPEGITFNVAIAPRSENVFTHTTTAGNIASSWTLLDHPALNGNPNARIIVTPVYVTTYNNKTVGVWYNGAVWSIYNQDESPMIEGAVFNVMILDDTNSFAHVADESNTFGDYTLLNDSRINGNPDANIIITQNWELGHVYNIPNIGVWYSDPYWSIYNEDESSLPLGAAYNVYIAWSETPVTSVDKETTIPTTFSLEQNYPNPFNPTTVISYQVSAISNVELKIYDVLGREVTTLVNEIKSPGRYEVNFDAGNLASGVYFYKINAGEFSASRKMMLIK